MKLPDKAEAISASQKSLPLIIAILSAWFGIATIEGAIFLATFAIFEAIYGSCSHCATSVVEAMRTHTATPELRQFMLESTGIAAAFVAALAVFYRRRAGSVIRIALLWGGLFCVLAGVLFLYFAVKSDNVIPEVIASVVWMAIGAAAAQIRYLWLKRRDAA